MLKWLLRIVLTIVLLPFVLAAVYWGWNWVQMRPDARFVSYLEQNASPVDLATDAPFAIAPEDLNKRLFLVGEVHGIKMGQDVDFAMFRMLNSKLGIRHYLGEFDPAQAAQFNAYLADGDEAHLRRVFSVWVAGNYQWANREFMDKLRKMKALNDTLPPERKIVFIGMDRVQDLPLMAEHLDQLLVAVPESTWPGQPALLAALAASGGLTDNTPEAPLVLAAVEALKTLPITAPEGTDTANWKALREALANLSDRAQVKGREAGITASFERLAGDPDYADVQFYGFWGQFHVLDATIQGAEPLVRRLQVGDSAFKGNIVSFSILNLKSEMMMPAQSFGSKEPYVTIPYTMDSPLLLFAKGINEPKKAAVGPITLFKMNAEGSPYPGTDKLGSIGGLMSMLQPFTMDAASVGPNGAAQYMILAESSPALTPLTAEDVKLE
jgi:hypothetical protein